MTIDDNDDDADDDNDDEADNDDDDDDNDDDDDEYFICKISLCWQNTLQFLGCCFGFEFSGFCLWNPTDAGAGGGPTTKMEIFSLEKTWQGCLRFVEPKGRKTLNSTWLENYLENVLF